MSDQAAITKRLERLRDAASGADDPEALHKGLSAIAEADPASGFEVAALWCESADPAEREIAAMLLDHLMWRLEEEARIHASRLLKPLLADPAEGVVEAALCALGHHDFYDPLLSDDIALWRHPADPVRSSFAAMIGCAPDQPRVERVLIELSHDPVANIRDWATFGLAVQSDSAAPEVLSALRARLDDDDIDVRAEALCGLAKRQQEAILPRLIDVLRGDVVTVPLVEAAEFLAKPELLPALREAASRFNDDAALMDRAIAACSG